MADGKLLSADKAVEQVRELYGLHSTEREELDGLRRYWKGRQKLPAVIPVGTPGEVRVMARSSRVNVMPIVINSLTQATYVDGYRGKGDDENSAVWSAWQANRMDARQAEIHRAAYAYGVSYAVVMPGDPEPIIRGVSPRTGTAIYGEDPDWPMWALERADNNLWKLYDDVAVYYVHYDPTGGTEKAFIESREHDIGVVPWIRYLDEHDLDDEDEVEPEGYDRCYPTRGQIAPLIPLQDQIDLTTFSLQIAQHYTGFRQRWIIGWTAESEAETLKVGAGRIIALANEESGTENQIKVGEFNQTELRGFIESREASLKHVATLSQTPVREVIGDLANPPSAEAMAAIDSARDRKVGERHTSLGESHEQMFALVAQLKGIELPNDGEVKWRDTSGRAFTTAIEGLAMISEKLQVPPQELWERVPETTKQEIERWKAAAQQGNSFDTLAALLERQAASAS